MPCVGMQGHSKPKIMAARGRKGAATRAEAFMPQVQFEELLICMKAASVDTIGDMLSFFLHGLNSPAWPHQPKSDQAWGVSKCI